MHIDVSTSLKNIDRVIKKLKKPNYSAIGNEAVTDVRRNFTTQGANIGESWPSLHPKRTGIPLRDKGLMMNSTHWVQQGKSVFVIVSRATMWKGKRVNLAWIHNYGTKIRITRKMRAWLHANGIHVKASTTHIKIPQRKFMALSGWAQKRCLQLLKKEVMS